MRKALPEAESVRVGYRREFGGFFYLLIFFSFFMEIQINKEIASIISKIMRTNKTDELLHISSNKVLGKTIKADKKILKTKI